MENNLEDSTLTIDLNSNPVQNPNESPNSRYEETSVGEMKSLFKDDQIDELIQELSRVKSENKRLTNLLTIVSRNLSDLKVMMQFDVENELSRTRKRKADDIQNINWSNHHVNICSNASMPNVVRSNRIHVRIDPTDVSLVVNDGYQWRKYGQKVTRDNPSPRAYYKCSFAPACPAKKKVQRSVDDPTLLVAIYEGQHHGHPAPLDTSATSPSSTGRPVSAQCAAATPTSVDCSKTNSESNGIQQFLVEKMASSLTSNSSFTTALAAAISGRIWNEVILSDDISNPKDFSL